jgi:hypothetical protein
MEIHSIDIVTGEEEGSRKDNVVGDCKKYKKYIVALVGFFLFFFDVASDVRLSILLRDANLQYLSDMVTLFILLPWALGVINLYIGALSYVKAYKFETCNRTCLIAGCPCTFFFLLPFPWFFDLLIPVYRVRVGFWPDEFINFMSEYEAQRALVEVLFESIPQSIIQIYIYANFSQLCPL